MYLNILENYHIDKTIEIDGVLAVILTAIGTMVGILRYRVSRRKANTPEYKATIGNSRINDLIKEIHEKYKGVLIVSIGEVTNGGGVQMTGENQYLKILFSTDTDTLNLFNTPHPMEPALLAIHARTLIKGDTFLFPKELTDRHTRAWYDSDRDGKTIKKTYVFLIGIERKKRSIVMYVNTDNEEALPHNQYLDLVNYTRKLGELFEKPKWWMIKKNLIT